MNGCGNEFVENLSISFIAYENWILGGCRETEFPPYFPREYFLISGRSMPAYDYYRDVLYHYVKQARGEGRVLDDIQELYTEAETRSPNEMRLLNEYCDSDDFGNQFTTQYSNVFEQTVGISREITHNVLHAYQAKYEIVGILFILENLLRIREGQLFDRQLEYLSDSRGRMLKGRAVNSVFTRLENKPNLKHLFGLGYFRDLRNTVGHNEYRITGNHIESLDGNISISKEEFFKSFDAIMDLQNVVKWVFSIRRKRTSIPHLSQQGLLTVMFRRFELLFNTITCYQLWCFSNEDHNKCWLKSIGFSRMGTDLRTTLTEAAKTQGALEPGLEFQISRLEIGDKLRCRIIPISPYIDPRKEPIFLDCGMFEKAGPSIDKEIVVERVDI